GNSLIKGFVSDSKGNALSDVEISIIGRTEKTLTTSGGTFFLGIKEYQNSSLRIRAFKNGYKSWNEYVDIPSENIIIRLEKN
ncbi:MAG: hypothetical protein OMM_14557, partial [Candidatus Magnetoglobus multicellularis str. Araruama]